ncbi:MAG: ABC transporter substrate-binding protein [Clostridia bacterium]|nr:ABC transporter substrate-binding protein [Clostridia bacterium]
MKTKLFLPLLLFSVLCVFTGCKGNKDEIYYLNFKPEVASVYDEIATAYKKETGVNLRVATAASGTYEQTLKSEIGKTDAPTIFQINGPQGYAAWKDYCADLSDTDIYKHLSDPSLALRTEDGVYGIPYVVEGYGIIYNEEITDKYLALKNRATDISSMEDIKSFATLKAVVEDMTRHKSELGISGVFAATSLKSGEDWRWQTHLANIPIHYELTEDGKGLTTIPDTADFRYANEYKQLFDLYVNNSTVDKKLLGSKEVADSMAEFALGKCAMVQNGNWAYGQISGIDGNVVKADKVKMLPLYTGHDGEERQGICIGTENYLAINSKASPEQQKAAADFLYWLYSSDTGKEFVTNKLQFIAPFDTFEKEDRPKDPLGSEVYRWQEKENVQNLPWTFTVFPGQNFKKDFGAALLQYVQGTKTWSQVVDTFKNRWAEES